MISTYFNCHIRACCKLLMALLLLCTSFLATHAQEDDFPLTEEVLILQADSLCACFERTAARLAKASEEEREKIQQAGFNCNMNLAVENFEAIEPYIEEISRRVQALMAERCPRFLASPKHNNQQKSNVSLPGQTLEEDLKRMNEIIEHDGYSNEEYHLKAAKMATKIIDKIDAGVYNADAEVLLQLLVIRQDSRRMNGEYEGSIADCQRTLMLLPDEANDVWKETYTTLYLSKLGKGDYKGAEKDIDTLLARVPEHKLALGATAVVMERQEKYKAAAVLMRKFMEQGYYNENTYAALGYNLIDAKEYTKGLKALDSAVILGNTKAKLFRYLGYTHYKLEHYEAAIDNLSKVLAIMPEHTNSLTMRGISYVEMGEYKKADVDLTKALPNDDNWATLYWRGRARVGTKRYKNAITDLEKAIALNNDAAIHYTLGQAYIGARQYNKAISAYTTSLEKYADDPDIHFERGTAYQKAGQNEAACKDFERAWELGKEEARKAISKYCK